MLKIGLIGYGKMGRMIEQVAHQKGHSIVTKNGDLAALKHAEICIDFSHPSVVMNNILEMAKLGKNLVIGTTGWYDNLSEVREIVREYQIGLLYSPNFSIGVNLFIKIVEEAAALIAPFTEYDVGVFEAHHNQKADSPSGTAKAIANALLNHIIHKNDIVENVEGRVLPHQLHVSSLRCGYIPGTHTVTFDSPADTITLTHQARSREGFARGAVVAAEWLHGKKGLFTLEDILEV